MHRHLLRILLAAGFAYPGPVAAQRGAFPPAPLPIQLQRIASGAGTIFSGRVGSVVPASVTPPDRVATVTVTFKVENPVRAVKAGQIYSFRVGRTLVGGRALSRRPTPDAVPLSARQAWAYQPSWRSLWSVSGGRQWTAKEGFCSHRSCCSPERRGLQQHALHSWSKTSPIRSAA